VVALGTLPDVVVGLEGAELGESMFGAGPALWVDGKEVLHRDADNSYDLRLTRAVIRELKGSLLDDQRVRFRRSTGSDWVEVNCMSVADEPFLAELVALAVRAHLPSSGTPVPPPSGAALARRRRFH
jgi:Family of unknown function (DUF5519)